MTFQEIYDQSQDQLSQRQRWATYLSMAIIILGMYIGMTLRDSALNQSTIYSNVQAGLTANYPEGWLLDENGPYIFRVRDMATLGFKTSIQVQALPVSADVVERNLLDQLTLSRSQFLIDYNVLGYSDFNLPNDTTAVSMNYTFVSRDTSPFLEGISSVVVGLDILTIQRGQALVITYRADASIYEQQLFIFDQFLQNLRY